VKRVAAVVGSLVIALAVADAGPRTRGGLIAANRPVRLARQLGPRRDIGAWHASWDRDLGTPIAMWGTHVDAPNSIANAAIALRSAKQFLADHLGELAPGASIDDFIVVANQVDRDRTGRGVRTIGFQQTWRGLRVVDAQIGIVFRNDRLFALTSTAMPNVAGDSVAKRGRVVLPLVHGPGDVEYRVADVVDVRGANERWDVFVAPDGKEIARRSTLLADTGTVEFNVGVRYASGARQDVAAPYVYVTANGSAAQTDGSGDVSWTGTDPATIVATAVGSGANIVNTAGSGATATLSLPSGGATSWNVSNVEFDDAQVSAYIYANIALARDRLINPSIAAFLAGPIEFEVNDPGSCNGFSDGNEVYLYQADSECENSARVADVVEHEFGHVFHNHSVISGVGSFTNDQGQDEGIADFNAANINNDSGVGRGLFYSERPARDIDPVGIERMYPRDVSSDPHITGEILSGALWDLRKTFIAQLGFDDGVTKTEAIFTGVMQRSPDLMGSYMAALIADDDDGDLGDGVPDQCAIERAFGEHGLVDGFVPTVIGSPSVRSSDQYLTVPVSAGTSTDSCAPKQLMSLTAESEVNGNFLEDTHLGDYNGTWAAYLAAQPVGSIIDYDLIATYDDGTTLSLPANAADPLYQAFSGSATPIACATMDLDPMWTTTGDDIWNWGPLPTNGAASGDPTAAHTGSAVLGTVIGGFNEGAYPASDQTAIEMPMTDVSAYAVVHLQYWRWLTVEDGTYDQAQITANGSAVWQNVASASGLIDHVDLEWRFQDVDVTPYVSEGQVQVSWSLTSDAEFQLGGWNLDDVCLVGLSKLPKCGDGILDPDEQCDDGNDFDGDGCSADCKLEVTATGGCNASTPGIGVGLLLLRRRRKLRR
jgi:cysteine-rich repeat protein